MAYIRPLSPRDAKRSLAARLGPTVDRVRQIATNLGVRPYRCFLVWTRATGVERGEGEEIEVKRTELLPTPLVESLDAVTRGPFASGSFPVGSIRLREVSTCFDFGTLTGRELPTGVREDVIPQPWDFFYEIVEDGRHDVEPLPQQFRLLAPPVLIADEVQWVIGLERIGEDTGRSPIPEETPDGPDCCDD